MGIAYNEFDNRKDTIAAGLKQKILASSDWSHLQLTTGTQATTLASGASIGDTSISTVASIPSGSIIVIGNGSANPEVRLTTGVTGSGPYTVSWISTEPLTKTYSSSANVGVGSYVKSTTTRGAQMVLDLQPVSPSTQSMAINVYQSHDGTTAGAVINRYLFWNRINSGTGAYILHCRVSVAKDWVYMDVEGPRAGESGADDGNYGSYRQCLYLGDITPYDAGDTTPAVVCVASAANSFNDTNPTVRVSRDRGNQQSWVIGRLATLTYPSWNRSDTNGNVPALAKNGDFVQMPWVAFENGDGLRGRVSYLHYGGIYAMGNPLDVPPPQPGMEMLYGAYKYRAVLPFRTDNAGGITSYGFGSLGNGVNWPTVSPILWVPVATNP